MKVLIQIIFAVSFMFATNVNANVILSLDPATQTANTGDIVSVNVMIDGLGDFVPLSLAVFDINVLFDSDILSFSGYNLFNNLGDLAAFDALDLSEGEYAAGVINIYEISFLSNFDLWDFQPGNFALAELLFTLKAPIGNQTSALSFSYIDIQDVNGDLINVIGLNEASITVPTPAAFMLISLALLAMFTKQKYRPQNIKKT